MYGAEGACYCRRMISLPIDAAIPELLEKLGAGSNLVLQAEPGAGKTTRVPSALLKAAFRKPDQEIWVLEPRRLAAKMAARRVADERGEVIGGVVGYQFRFENVGSAATRLRFLTEGMLMRRLIGARREDPTLSKVAAVVLDEFHERHLHGDVALAYLKNLQQTVRPDLRLVVMSATIDTDLLSKYLGGAPVMRVPGRTYEVSVEYWRDPIERAELGRWGVLERAVRDCVKRELERAPREDEAGADESRGNIRSSSSGVGLGSSRSRSGDILVFLPGMAEIRRCTEAIETSMDREQMKSTVVLPLHGELSRDEQDRAVDENLPQRKVILATNVAETSLTLPGVTVVIDAGLSRVASYSNWSGLSRLQTKGISRASAIQRAGRAGRTSPGRCIRLYGKHDFDGRPSYEVPEIQRADLAQTLLELKRLGVADLAAFPWFEAPAPSAVEASQALLYRLGALDADGKLSAMGERLADWPAHPRLGRLMFDAAKRGVAKHGARLAAALSELRASDLGAGGLGRLLQGGSIELPHAAKKLEERFIQSVGQLPSGVSGGPSPVGSISPVSVLSGAEIEKALTQSLLAAFPDRVAKKRAGQKPGSVELQFSSGGTASIENSAELAHGEFFLALDAEEKKGLGQNRAEVRVQTVCQIQPEWLFDLEPQQVSESEDMLWDQERGRLESRYRMKYDALVLEESVQPPQNLEQAARVMARALLESRNASWLLKISDVEALKNLKHRFRFLGQQAGVIPEGALPDLENADVLESLLAQLVQGQFSMNALSEANFPAFILDTLDPSVRGKVDSLAPENVQLKNGRRCKVNYEADQPPWIESRLQDFFGMTVGPALVGGRVPLTIHLLAPNYRAVQVTKDLPGFWSRIYPDLRRELGRRYPRHAWPEDPLKPLPPK